MEVEQEEILYLGFNQDFTCFTVGTTLGFRVYTTNPLHLSFKRNFPGSLGIVELLNRTNIIALTGGGAYPRYATNKVIFWDDLNLGQKGEIILDNEVKAVKLTDKAIVISTQDKVLVYNMANLQLIDSMDTYANPFGVFAICCSPQLIVACPGLLQGQVRIKNYTEDITSTISAHNSSIARLTLNPDGQILATASDKGTIIRVFDTRSHQLIREFRRGIDRADILSISFNYNSEWVACTSDKGTIHIFSLSYERSNTKSRFSFMKSFMTYFDSE